MTAVVLIHGGESTATKLRAALPGSSVSVAYRPGLSASYDENTGIAHDYPTLERFLAEYAPSWKKGEPLVLLGFSAGGWALRYYLRDARARELVTAAVFLDSTYCGEGCDPGPSFGGVVEFGRAANAAPDRHRLVMTYSAAHPGPGRGAVAIERAAGAGAGIFVRGYEDADHSAQQGIVGPAIVAELIRPWIGGAGGSGLFGWLLVPAAGLFVYALGWRRGWW